MKKNILTIAMAFAALTAIAAVNNAEAASTPLWLRDVQISPDGSQIVFCYKGDIYKVAAKGGDAVRLTSQKSYECSPVWSADGKKIAFASDRHGNFDVFNMSAEGGDAKRLTFNSVSEVPQAFSPDGKWVYFGAAISDPAESASFPTGTLPELYRVPTEGGRTEQVLATPAEMLSFAPDASADSEQALSFYYQDKKGYEDEWRKHHTSSITRDIWYYDGATGKHVNLTRHAGEDRNPVVSADGTTLYYLSERDGGSMNVYKCTKGSKCAPVDGDRAIEAQPVTKFTTHPVRFLSLSRTGTLCYTYDGEIYTQRQGAEPQRVGISLTRDDAPQVADLSFANGARQGVVSRDGKQVAFVVRGDVFVTSTEYATTNNITQTAHAECGVDFAPDGRSLVYASEDGHWQLKIAKIARAEDPNFANATVIDTELIFPADDKTERCWPKFSPDGKKVAFIESRTKLKVVDLATKQVTEITDGSKWYDQDGHFNFQWSPDGKWFVLDFIAHQRDPYYDQGIVSAEGGEIHPVTDSGYMTGGGRWVMDGKAILFQSERYGMRSHASWGSQDDVFLAFLTQDAYDRFRLSPEDYALLKEVEKASAAAKGEEKAGDKNGKDGKAKKDDKANAKGKGKKDDKADAKGKQAKGAPAAEAKEEAPFDFDHIADRIVRLTPNSANIGDAILSKDGEKLYYYAAFESGMDLWKIDLRKRETKLLSKTNSKSPSLTMDNDGNLYALGGDAMKKIDGKSEALTPISFTAKMKLDLTAEREYMYNHMAKQIEEKIFRTDYNGCDWPAMVEAYRKFLPHIANNYDYQELLSEILGELNVSHTGGRYYASFPGSDNTAQLGLLLRNADQHGGYEVVEVLEGGPFDRATSKVKAGDTIVAINGESVEGRDLSELLNLMAGKKTLVSFRGAAGEWSEVVLPISAARQADLLYDRWVKGRAAEVERLSGGRLGYVHIKGMNDASYRSVYSDILGKYNQKEGIVIDTRYNGGGRLHEDIEILFSGQHYFTQVIRGREVCDMPSRRYNHPSIMLQAEGNYSNAHGTPWVYKHKEMGKLVGSPVPGTMSSVNWERLQDETLVFGCPVIGYRLPDGTYLENTQLEPDIYILNNPATVVKGEDLQLEAAVKTLLEDIDAQKK